MRVQQVDRSIVQASDRPLHSVVLHLQQHASQVHLLCVLYIHNLDEEQSKRETKAREADRGGCQQRRKDKVIARRHKSDLELLLIHIAHEAQPTPAAAHHHHVWQRRCGGVPQRMHHAFRRLLQQPPCGSHLREDLPRKDTVY